MSFTYLDAATLAFGKREFAAADFARRTGSPRSAKILSELKRRGLVERVGRGRYRLLAPDERPDLRSGEWERVRTIVLDAPFLKAWTGSTAVEIWTKGRYRTAPTPFLREFFVAVPKDSVEAFKDYLESKNVSTGGRKRVGAVVRLIPTDRLETEVVDGERVISRRDVERLIEAHPATYGEAGSLLA